MAKTILVFLLLSIAVSAQTNNVRPLQLGGGGDPPDVVKREREALKKVKLTRFTVNPLIVKPFGTVAASWSVTVPPVDTTGFDIVIELNGTVVPSAGTQTFTVTRQMDFALTAVISDDPTVGRILRQWTVHLDVSECQTQVFPAILVTDPLKAQFDNVFGSSDQFTLKDGGTVVTAGNSTVDIEVPLTINVPDWFDADMNIAIQLEIAGSSQVVVIDKSVNANVTFSALSNWLSFGCTDAVGDGMSQMSNVFLKQIVDAELVPQVRQALTDQVTSFTNSLTAADPQHRTYVLSQLSFSSGTGLIIVACPK